MSDFQVSFWGSSLLQVSECMLPLLAVPSACLKGLDCIYTIALAVLVRLNPISSDESVQNVFL
jgi:hypothetical protein